MIWSASMKTIGKTIAVDCSGGKSYALARNSPTANIIHVFQYTGGDVEIVLWAHVAALRSRLVRGLFQPC